MSFIAGSPSSSVIVSYASLTDVGLHRAHNEDALVCQLLPAPADAPVGEADGARVDDLSDHALLLAVCDGMGGSEGGEVASALATTALGRGLLAGPLPASEPELAAHLVATVEGAHELVRDTAWRRRLPGMGTTATAVLIRGDRALVGQVGDSRAYLWREGRLAQLTRDQSLAQQMIELGQLRPEDRRTFEYGNIILQALGSSSSLDVDLTATSLRRGDLLLVCSDGLWGEIDDDRIAALLARDADPAALCRALVAAAIEAGGSDNVSCIVCRLDGDGLPRPAPEDGQPGYLKLKFPDVVPSPAPTSTPVDTAPTPLAPRAARDLGPVELPMAPPPFAGAALLLAAGAALAAMLWRCVG